jgi:glutathione S-transferase
MKLYYSKAACSLAPHIVLEELGTNYELIAVDLRKEPTPEFLSINPMGAVPVLVLDNGQAITEDAVILQYLADTKPETNLVPRSGTLDRYRLQEWLNFIATEIHKGFSPLWIVEALTSSVEAQEQIRKFTIGDLSRKFDVIVHKLGNQPFLMPLGYTVADAYLFTILNWSKILKIDLSAWPALVEYMERVQSRPATQRALKAEHLI